MNNYQFLSVLSDRRLTLSAPTLIVFTALWIAMIDNTVLWTTLYSRLDFVSVQGLGYVLTLLGIIVLLFSLPMFILGQRNLLKPLLAFLLLLSGVLAYFTADLGIVFDKEMVRNLLEAVSDQNTQEGLELVSFALLASVAMNSLVPLIFVFWVRIKPSGLLFDNAYRLGYLFIMIAVVAVLVLANFKSITYISRENNDLRRIITPSYALHSVQRLIMSATEANKAVFVTLGADAVQQRRSKARRVGILVVGETARADHFSLNGYARDTNPELTKRDIINFSNVRSCGTSTAYSVPCMFSFLDQENYTPELAAAQSNVLDVLLTAGVDVFWIDSNSSCKRVCQRVPSVNIMQNPLDTKSALYVDGAYQDEFLLSLLDEQLDKNNDRDLLIVLHTMGSHGPAYYRRYPEISGVFQPACRSKAPHLCLNSDIVNAYDNTVHYTDSVLSAIVDKLAAREGQNFMFYASDHGESLGENGVYLHGLPRSIAPDSQRHVPMLAWFSDELAKEMNSGALVRGVVQDERSLSHDAISASILGLFDVVSDTYRLDLDVFQHTVEATLLATHNAPG